jgi:hypothetical protein
MSVLLYQADTTSSESSASRDIQRLRKPDRKVLKT